MSPGATPASLLRARRLGRRIDDRWIWRDVSVELGPGERLGLEGPSGAGKTLLLRVLACLDPADEGEIALRGRPLGAAGVVEYRARVVYLHQRPALWDGSVEQNLEWGLDFEVHSERRYRRDRILRWLERFGRNEAFLAAHSDDLSGGEAQMVALLRALQTEPGVLLLDEPTAAMDGDATRATEALLAEWIGDTAPNGDREPSGRAYVWSSHDAAQLQRVADRVLELDRAAHASEPGPAETPPDRRSPAEADGAGGGR